jgi:hypothetical protein
MTTQSHELRRPQTQPVPARYAEGPLGPRDCKRHSFPGKLQELWRHGDGDSPYAAPYERGILREMLPGVPPWGLILRAGLSRGFLSSCLGRPIQTTRLAHG